ncbi:hypothetical protein [Burkholderia sp. MSMB175]|uniref:hypothetical protein n=1 Tax=Burkholderia sp. MSMB175 TaxID=1086510 RepID=UPI001CA47893|nr:hypothetical protein [Burkholderia sp. MSMB175]
MNSAKEPKADVWWAFLTRFQFEGKEEFERKLFLTIFRSGWKSTSFAIQRDVSLAKKWRDCCRDLEHFWLGRLGVVPSEKFTL